MAELIPFIKIWSNAMEMIKNEGIVPNTSYETWFEPLKVVDQKKAKLYLAAPNDFIREWVDTTYKSLLKRYLDKASQGQIADVSFVLLNNNGTYIPVDDEEEEEKGEIIKFYAPTEKNTDPYASTELNPRYTFESFVVGSNNHLAHAAALAVAEMPGKSYNPLFFHGGVGLGKTHLMQAIANFVIENNLRARVGYFSAETFVNEFVNAISNNSTDKFRAKYRSYDVILIDDIQFFSGKSSCQEEFFHTYNALYNGGSQIILSSDRPPMEIPDLEDRLVSRFSGGLTTEILAPGFETRVAILKNKAQLENIFMEDEVFYYIANQVDSNIRALEGSLNQVAAYAKANKTKATRDVAEAALKNNLPEKRQKPITLEVILQVTAQYFKTKSDDLKSSKRSNTVAFPRQIAMYLARELTDMTYDDIGREFKKDHSTIMYGHDKIAKAIETEQKTKKFIDDITKIIRNM
ncbi:MAG: chromosomal replication initiator protein DnaA [Bacillota bacterium]|nr:chromosomal replication initiator protein DnaA [Bacillota bacterium]